MKKSFGCRFMLCVAISMFAIQSNGGQWDDINTPYGGNLNVVMSDPETSSTSIELTEFQRAGANDKQLANHTDAISANSQAISQNTKSIAKINKTLTQYETKLTETCQSIAAIETKLDDLETQLSDASRFCPLLTFNVHSTANHSVSLLVAEHTITPLLLAHHYLP